VLSMSFDSPVLGLGTGVGIATYVNGAWVNAVDQNFGGTKKFVDGPYIPGTHGLGAYGVDSRRKTAWAVLNYNADFAVAQGVGHVPRPAKDPLAHARSVLTRLLERFFSWK